MNRTEQMAMGFAPPMAELNHIFPCVHSYTPSLPATGESQMLQELSFPHLESSLRSQSRRWDVQRFLTIACRAAVECLAMIGCVLFGALATLLFGL